MKEESLSIPPRGSYPVSGIINMRWPGHNPHIQADFFLLLKSGNTKTNGLNTIFMVWVGVSFTKTITENLLEKSLKKMADWCKWQDFPQTPLWFSLWVHSRCRKRHKELQFVFVRSFRHFRHKTWPTNISEMRKWREKKNKKTNVRSFTHFRPNPDLSSSRF